MYFFNPAYPNPVYGINIKIINEILMIFYTVLVCEDCHNEIPQIGLKQQMLTFSQFWRQLSPRPRWAVLISP